MAKFFWTAAPALLFASTAAPAQDMWQTQMDNQTNSTHNYWQTATAHNTYMRETIEKANGQRSPASRYAGERSNSTADKKERSRQTCANARRMYGADSPQPAVHKLLTLCNQAGY